MAAQTSDTLPEDFLAKPSPNVRVQRIDFSKTSLPEYDGLYAVILDGVMDEEECKHLLAAAEAKGDGEWERAMINIGAGRQKLITDERNCGRIIWDSREIVAKIWQRIEQVPEVQEIQRLENAPRVVGNGPVKRGEVWKFTRPNERMRFLKYVGGEFFRPHCDGSYETPDGTERSYFTMHLYLNNAGDVPDSEFAEMDRKEQAKVLAMSGGATSFHSLASLSHDQDYDVAPKTGRVLLFQHRGLLHSGDDVLAGVKYTMRTDLMYTIEKQ